MGLYHTQIRFPNCLLMRQNIFRNMSDQVRLGLIRKSVSKRSKKLLFDCNGNISVIFLNNLRCSFVIQMTLCREKKHIQDVYVQTGQMPSSFYISLIILIEFVERQRVSNLELYMY